MVLSEAGWLAPYWPIGGLAVTFTLFYAFADSINKFMSKYFRWFRVGQSLELLEEGLDNYWCALSKSDRLWTEKEENYRRQSLGMPMMTDE